MNLKKKKKGFTLIELMAVIAIIAILAAVLVPTVTGYINRAKKTAVISECRTLMNAIESYNAVGGNIQMSGNTVEEEFAQGGQLAGIDSDLVKSTDLTHIEDATLAEVKEINDNEDGNIINRIKMNGDKFDSLISAE